MRLIRSRRSPGGVIVDEFELGEGGRLLAPFVAEWEIEARRQWYKAEQARLGRWLNEPRQPS